VKHDRYFLDGQMTGIEDGYVSVSSGKQSIWQSSEVFGGVL
jgi:hypothetical protein